MRAALGVLALLVLGVIGLVYSGLLVFDTEPMKAAQSGVGAAQPMGRPPLPGANRVRLRNMPQPNGQPAVRVASGLVVPVAGVTPDKLVDTWGQSRENGARAHEGIDIMAPKGTPVVAAAPGLIEKLFISRRGGVTAYVRSQDRALTYYYSHLHAYVPGLREGQQVRAGDVIGYVGETGNVPPGSPHLHFAINTMRADEKWWQGQATNPYPLLAGNRASR